MLKVLPSHHLSSVLCLIVHHSASSSARASIPRPAYHRHNRMFENSLGQMIRYTQYRGCLILYWELSCRCSPKKLRPPNTGMNIHRRQDRVLCSLMLPLKYLDVEQTGSPLNICHQGLYCRPTAAIGVSAVFPCCRELMYLSLICNSDSAVERPPPDIALFKFYHQILRSCRSVWNWQPKAYYCRSHLQLFHCAIHAGNLVRVAGSLQVGQQAQHSSRSSGRPTGARRLKLTINMY